MPYNGTGTFNRVYNWVNDKANGINITASRFDTEDNGFATGLSTCITKDGQQTTTASIPFAVGINVNQGSVSAPSIAVTGDLSTGFYQTTTGELRFSSEGVYTATLNASGFSATQLNITQAGSSQAYFGSTGNNDCDVTLNDASGSNQCLITFQNGGTTVWNLFKGSGDSGAQFILSDVVNSKSFFTCNPGGNFVLGPAQEFFLNQAGQVLIQSSSSISGENAWLQVTGASAATPLALQSGSNNYFINFHNSSGTSISNITTDGTNTTLGGTWKASTPTVNNSSTTLATTAFCNPASSLSTNGYVELPSGIYIQWGQASSGTAATLTVNFPIAFPNAVYSVTATNNQGATAFNFVAIGTTSTSQFQVTQHNQSGTIDPPGINWIAIGS